MDHSQLQTVSFLSLRASTFIPIKEFIEDTTIYTVKNLLIQIEDKILKFNQEKLSYNLYETIVSGDILCSCVDYQILSQGSIFIFLQISEKDGGLARVSAFVSQPDGEEGITPSELISRIHQYINNTTRVEKDLNTLKDYVDEDINSSWIGFGFGQASNNIDKSAGTLRRGMKYPGCDMSISITLTFGEDRGNVYLLDNNKKTIEKINVVIEGISTNTVKHLLETVRDDIVAFEKPHDYTNGISTGGGCVDGKYIGDAALLRKVKQSGDIVYMCVQIYHWRRGFGFVYLQISEMDGGNARLFACVTDTIHHSAFCFGTTPDAENAVGMIRDYVKGVSDHWTQIKPTDEELLKKSIENKQRIEGDLELLKSKNWVITKNIRDLRETMKMPEF